jgi:hypothetical protein
MQHDKELMFSVKNGPGRFAKILATKGASLLAIVCWFEILFVTGEREIIKKAKRIRSSP